MSTMAFSHTSDNYGKTGGNNATSRQSITKMHPEVLTDIYQDDINMVVWQRKLSTDVEFAVKRFLLLKPNFQQAMTVTPKNVSTSLSEIMSANDDTHSLIGDITEIVDMFCCLFDLKQVGLRLSALNHAMCPKFHVDRVPCRLITTYQGIATEWLPHNIVDRSKLGTGGKGKPDEQSGLFHHSRDIQHLETGDVALLKGELWEGNENAGVVHRSPHLPAESRRLLFTLDFVDS